MSRFGFGYGKGCVDRGLDEACFDLGVDVSDDACEDLRLDGRGTGAEC